MNASGFFGLENFEGVKDGCHGEVQSENLAGGDWTRCGSPSMTQGMSRKLIYFELAMAVRRAPSCDCGIVSLRIGTLTNVRRFLSVPSPNSFA